MGIALVLCMANFAIFLVMGAVVGGYAQGGHIADGHFFLDNHSLVGHAAVTEVSYPVYLYSLWHERVTFGSFVVLVVVPVIANLFAPKHR